MVDADRAVVLWGGYVNPNYKETITIYNCLKAGDNPDKKDIWYCHVLHNCFYKNVIGLKENGKGLQMANGYTVRIPQSLKYKPYREWCSLEETEREQYFTLSENDIVIKGECHEEITGTGASTASQILNKHKPEAFRITAISDNTHALAGKHYRLGG